MLKRGIRPTWLWVLSWTIASVLFSGACISDPSGQPPEFRVEDVRIVVSTESELLSRPADIAVHEDGQLYVLDNLAAQVLVLSADGELQRTIGRQGGGPREFKRPLGFKLGLDTIRVVDVGNGRLQTLALNGDYTRTTALPIESGMGPIAISDDGGFLAGTVGLHDALAAHYDPAGVQLRVFGTPPAPASSFMSFTKMKEEIIDGKVPALFRNAVLPAFAPNGDMWLILRGEGRLERYDSDGLQQVSVPLETPEMERAWELCVEKAKETLNDQRRLMGLSYVFDAGVMGHTLWLLLNTPDDAPAVMLAVASDGKVVQRVLFSSVLGAHNFAFDRGGGKVYFTIPSAASIVAASVPDSILLL